MTCDDRPLYYILHGDIVQPMTTQADVHAWSAWMDDPAHRIVARTCLDKTGALLPLMAEDVYRNPRGTHACVSTVFLGIDYAYAWQTDGAPPILFETMIYLTHGARIGPGSKGHHSEFLDVQWRYVTAAQAQATHARIVDQCQTWLRAGRSLAVVGDDEWVDENGEETSHAE